MYVSVNLPLEENNFFCYVWVCQRDSTLSDGKHEQNSRLVVTVLIANSDNATMENGDSHYYGLL